MVALVKSKVKSRSHPAVAHLRPLTSVPAKYQLVTPYGFRDIAQTKFKCQGHYSKVEGDIKATP